MASLANAPSVQLASKSPRRAELLEQIAVPFRVVSVDVDETRRGSEPVQDFVVRLAETKARAGFEISPRLPTLGSDTIVYCEGEIFGKPTNKDDALRMLAKMSANSHEVFTAVAVYDGERLLSELVVSQVKFRAISDSEAEAYWQTGEPSDKAGGYGIQGKAAVFIEELKGSYSAVMGLPLCETASLLRKFDVPVWAE